jgi:hypothetical protein
MYFTIFFLSKGPKFSFVLSVYDSVNQDSEDYLGTKICYFLILCKA